jgi:Flp pilus assembly protein TadD
MHCTDQFARGVALRALATVLLTGTVWCAGCQTTTERTPVPYGQSMGLDDDFEDAAGREPTARTLYTMGRVLSAQGNATQADATLRACLQRYPDYLPAYAELAELYLRHRKLDAAGEILGKALELSPDDPVLNNDLGMCRLLAGDSQEALTYFERAAVAFPDDARYTANMAMVNGMLGQYDDALALYMEVVPTREAHYNVAVLAEANDDQERAALEYGLAGSRARTR